MHLHGVGVGMHDGVKSFMRKLKKVDSFNVWFLKSKSPILAFAKRLIVAVHVMNRLAHSE